MTDLAIPTTTTVAPTPPPITDLDQWVRDAAAAFNLSSSLCKTSFVPAAYRNKPEEGAAAILAGKRWGLDPLAAMQAFDIIQGQAAPRAITLRAIVQSCGHDIWVEEEDGQHAIVKAIHGITGREHSSTWDLTRAKGLDLLGKDNWKKQPQAMLVARATGECARRVAADQILGIGYTSEELRDGSISGEVVARASVAALTAIPHDPTTGEVIDPEWEHTEMLAAEVAGDEAADRAGA